MNAEAVIIDQAIAWHVRLAEASDAEWADFVAWLEADPAHAAAYDVVATQDSLLDDARFPAPAPVAANDNPRARWPWLLGGTAAAAAIVALLAPTIIAPRATSYQVATRDGERRTVALGDGTSIEMSGGTSLTLDRANPRVASLDRGEAVFHVRHDAARPFEMTAGGVTIQDLGTVFDVAHGPAGVTVAVSEGSVLFQPTRDAITLIAGDTVTARKDGSAVVRTRTDAGSVGGWRVGMLSFEGERLVDVAARIERLYGIHIALDGDLSDRPFTGMVRFTGTADRDVPHLAELIGVTWRRDGDRWIFSERAKPSR